MKTTKHRFTAKFLILLILPVLLSLSSCNGKKPFNLNTDNINYINFMEQTFMPPSSTYTKEDPEFYELIDLVNSFEYESSEEWPRSDAATGRNVEVRFGEELIFRIGYVMELSEGGGIDYRVINYCYGESYNDPPALIAKDTEFCERLMEYGFPGWTLEKENAERDAQASAAYKSRAGEFIERVLNLPSQEFVEYEEKYARSGDVELMNEKFLEAAKSLCGGYVAESIYEGKSTFFGNVITTHAVAAGNGYSWKVLSYEVEEASEKNFSYTAMIEDSREAEPYKMTGNIQFDEDNLIDYMTAQRR